MSLRYAGCFEIVIYYRLQQFAFAFKTRPLKGGWGSELLREEKRHRLPYQVAAGICLRPTGVVGQHFEILLSAEKWHEISWGTELERDSGNLGLPMGPGQVPRGLSPIPSNFLS